MPPRLTTASSEPDLDAAARAAADFLTAFGMEEAASHLLNDLPQQAPTQRRN